MNNIQRNKDTYTKEILNVLSNTSYGENSAAYRILKNGLSRRLNEKELRSLWLMVVTSK